MNFQAMFGAMGENVDRGLIKWRQEGVRGTPAERERFHKEQFHGARGMIGMGIEARLAITPGATRLGLLQEARESILAVSAFQADESGFNDDEKAYYVGIMQEVLDSLAERYRAEG